MVEQAVSPRKWLILTMTGSSTRCVSRYLVQIVEVVDDERRLAVVEVAGVRRKFNIGLLDLSMVVSRPATGC